MYKIIEKKQMFDPEDAPCVDLMQRSREQVAKKDETHKRNFHTRTQ